MNLEETRMMESPNASRFSEFDHLHVFEQGLSDEALRIIDMLRGFKQKGAAAAKAETGTPEERRLRSLLRMVEGRHDMDAHAAAAPLPDGISVAPALADGVRCEWQRWLAEDPEKQAEKVILFLHGGGFSGGSALTRRPMSTNLVRHAKIDCLSVDYRLSPEHRFPAALEDCETAYVWLLKQGYRPRNIFVTGESAGANLTVALGHALKAHSLPLPGTLCPFSPVVDLADAYPSRVLRANRDPMIGAVIDEADIPAELAKLSAHDVASASHYCGPEERKNPLASPIWGDFTGFPRMLVHVGSEEILYDDSVALTRKARAQDVEVEFHEWQGLFHSFPIFAFPEADEACRLIGAHVRAMR